MRQLNRPTGARGSSRFWYEKRAHVSLECSQEMPRHLRRTISRLIYLHCSKSDLACLPPSKSCQEFNQKDGSETPELARISRRSDTERRSGTQSPDATAPAAPTGLAATNVGAGRVTLTWTDNSSNERA